MARSDRFHSFAGLAKSATEGVDYSIFARQRPSAIAVLAPHGGGIEAGTSEVARGLAGHALSIYCFQGLKGSRNCNLHIASTRFDEPRCEELIAATRVVVTVHGMDDRGSTVYVGGRHMQLKGRILRALTEAGFNAMDDDTSHSGTNSHNLCNRGTAGRGVQIELTNGLRRRMFLGPSRRARTKTTDVFSAFIAAVQPLLAEDL